MMAERNRVIVIDDNAAIHDDFRKILLSTDPASILDEAETALFGRAASAGPKSDFELDYAFQGEEGVGKVLTAFHDDHPFAIAFVDMEMPPGCDGLETAQRILAADSHIQVVICTAYSQRSWSEVANAVDDSDRLLIIKKPFDVEEIVQLAHSLSRRWHNGRQAERLADSRARMLASANAALREQIRERRNAETALGLSEERLQLALDAANDGLFDWDVARGTVYFSPRWQKMLGYEVGSILGTPRTFRDLIHPQDIRKALHSLRAHIRGEVSTFEQEYRMRHANGEWIWILCRAKSVDRIDRSSVRIVGTHTDISERKWIEESMMAREKQFRTIVSNIPGAVYRRFADEGCTTKFVSDNIESISGYPASDFINNARRSFWSIVHGEDLEETQRVLDAAIDSQEPYTLEYRVIDVDRNTKWVLEKGMVSTVPGSAVPYLDGVILDVTETHDLTEQLSYHESRDVLTGLLNRTEFTRELQQALAAATAGQAGFALCYVDLDNFKVVNDTCGQAGGDKLLGDLGAALSERLRGRDTIARLGGDEFGVLLRGCSDEHLKHVSESICDVADKFRFDWEGSKLRISASVGVVALNSDMQSVEDVLRISEAACYVAKESGRNQSHIYRKDDSVVVRRSDQMHWVPRIHLALDQNRFKLYRQPIASLGKDSEGDERFEILLRMLDRRGRIIAPGEFLPAAERFHLAKRIDRWVVRSVIRWLSETAPLVSTPRLCSVNLSGQSITDERFCADIIQMLEEAHIEPGNICFEVTETAAVANLRSAQSFLHSLREYGCRTALDDFGAGLSSFGYLASLPVDILKIDGMFVRDIAENPVHEAMVRAINEVGQLMDKQTVAEFVEDDAALAILKEIGVDYGQGFGIGRPVPV